MIILVNIANDQLSRGDTHGRIGIARAIAKKTGGRVLYADTKTLAAAYPDIRADSAIRADEKYLTKSEGSWEYHPHDLDYTPRLAQFMLDNGLPDMILGLHCPRALAMVGRGDGRTIVNTDLNDSFSAIHLRNRDLVAHNLTTENLAEAGKSFDSHYPDIKKPLIAVFLADPWPDTCDKFTERMAALASHHAGATIFLCGSRRTKPEILNEITEKMTASLAGKNISDRVDVVTYHHVDNDPHNPYRGLIARADHFILWGTSQSMVSEPLMAGKTVHLYNAHIEDKNLTKGGLTAQFTDAALDAPLPTRHFTPVDVTAIIAERLYESAQKWSPMTTHILEKNIAALPDDQQQWLRAIHQDPRTIRDIPAALDENDDFILAAMSANGIALQYLDAGRRANPVIAAAAITENFCAARHADPALMDDADFVIPLVKLRYELTGLASARLLRDTAFCTAIRAIEHRVETYFDEKWLETLRDNADYMLATISQYRPYSFKASPRLLADTGFLQKAVTRSPYIYDLLDLQQQQSPPVAAAYYAAFPCGLNNVTAGRNDLTICALSLAYGDRKNMGHIPKKLEAAALVEAMRIRHADSRAHRHAAAEYGI